jgi:hypothetical protein
MSERIHPSVLSGYGLIEARFDAVTLAFATRRRADQSQMTIIDGDATAADALHYLAVRTFPATRLVMVDLGDWTAALTNSRNGSDFNDHQYWAGRTVSERTIRVVDREARWWRRGARRERLNWEARIFELHAADDSTIRAVTCMDDGGRWDFFTVGDPLPIEASFAYDAPKKRDRFTSSNLHELLEAVGPGPLTQERFFRTPRFALLADCISNDEWRERVEASACSLEDADDPAFGYYQRGMSFVPFMNTHAASVIHDFELAVEINPAYEPKVRDHLREARRISSR